MIKIKNGSRRACAHGKKWSMKQISTSLLKALLPSAILALALTACGGSSSGGGSTPPAPDNSSKIKIYASSVTSTSGKAMLQGTLGAQAAATVPVQFSVVDPASAKPIDTIDANLGSDTPDQSFESKQSHDTQVSYEIQAPPSYTINDYTCRLAPKTPAMQKEDSSKSLYFQYICSKGQPAATSPIKFKVSSTSADGYKSTTTVPVTFDIYDGSGKLLDAGAASASLGTETTAANHQTTKSYDTKATYQISAEKTGYTVEEGSKQYRCNLTGGDKKQAVSFDDDKLPTFAYHCAIVSPDAKSPIKFNVKATISAANHVDLAALQAAVSSKVTFQIKNAHSVSIPSVSSTQLLTSGTVSLETPDSYLESGAYTITAEQTTYTVGAAGSDQYTCKLVNDQSQRSDFASFNFTCQKPMLPLAFDVVPTIKSRSLQGISQQQNQAQSQVQAREIQQQLSDTIDFQIKDSNGDLKETVTSPLLPKDKETSVTTKNQYRQNGAYTVTAMAKDYYPTDQSKNVFDCSLDAGKTPVTQAIDFSKATKFNFNCTQLPPATGLEVVNYVSKLQAYPGLTARGYVVLKNNSANDLMVKAPAFVNSQPAHEGYQGAYTSADEPGVSIDTTPNDPKVYMPVANLQSPQPASCGFSSANPMPLKAGATCYFQMTYKAPAASSTGVLAASPAPDLLQQARHAVTMNISYDSADGKSSPGANSSEPIRTIALPYNYFQTQQDVAQYGMLASNHVNKVFVNPDDHAKYIATDSGLTIIYPQKNKADEDGITRTYTMSDGLVSNNVHSVYALTYKPDLNDASKNKTLVFAATDNGLSVGELNADGVLIGNRFVTVTTTNPADADKIPNNPWDVAAAFNSSTPGDAGVTFWVAGGTKGLWLGSMTVTDVLPKPRYDDSIEPLTEDGTNFPGWDRIILVHPQATSSSLATASAPFIFCRQESAVRMQNKFLVMGKNLGVSSKSIPDTSWKYIASPVESVNNITPNAFAVANTGKGFDIYYASNNTSNNVANIQVQSLGFNDSGATKEYAFDSLSKKIGDVISVDPSDTVGLFSSQGGQASSLYLTHGGNILLSKNGENFASVPAAKGLDPDLRITSQTVDGNTLYAASNQGLIKLTAPVNSVHVDGASLQRDNSQDWHVSATTSPTLISNAAGTTILGRTNNSYLHQSYGGVKSMHFAAADSTLWPSKNISLILAKNYNAFNERVLSGSGGFVTAELNEQQPLGNGTVNQLKLSGPDAGDVGTLTSNFVVDNGQLLFATRASLPPIIAASEQSEGKLFSVNLPAQASPVVNSVKIADTKKLGIVNSIVSSGSKILLSVDQNNIQLSSSFSEGLITATPAAGSLGYSIGTPTLWGTLFPPAAGTPSQIHDGMYLFDSGEDGKPYIATNYTQPTVITQALYQYNLPPVTPNVVRLNKDAAVKQWVNDIVHSGSKASSAEVAFATNEGTFFKQGTKDSVQLLDSNSAALVDSKVQSVFLSSSLDDAAALSPILAAPSDSNFLLAGKQVTTADPATQVFKSGLSYAPIAASDPQKFTYTFDTKDGFPQADDKQVGISKIIAIKSKDTTTTPLYYVYVATSHGLVMTILDPATVGAKATS